MAMRQGRGVDKKGIEGGGGGRECDDLIHRQYRGQRGKKGIKKVLYLTKEVPVWPKG